MLHFSLDSELQAMTVGIEAISLLVTIAVKNVKSLMESLFEKTVKLKFSELIKGCIEYPQADIFGRFSHTWMT